MKKRLKKTFEHEDYVGPDIKEMIERNEVSIENNMITCLKPVNTLTHELAADLATHRIAFMGLQNIYKEEDLIIYDENGETKYTCFGQILFWCLFVHFMKIIKSHEA